MLREFVNLALNILRFLIELFIIEFAFLSVGPFTFYLVIDIFMLIVSYFAIKKVKVQCVALINNRKYKEYRQEAEIALAEVLYLPNDYESEEEEL